MYRLFIVLFAIFLTACASNQLTMDDVALIQVGQSRNEVMRIIRKPPSSISTTKYENKGYIGYYYPMLLGIDDATHCYLVGNNKICDATASPHTEAYVFVFQDPADPSLAFHGVVSDLVTGEFFSTEREILEQFIVQR